MPENTEGTAVPLVFWMRALVFWSALNEQLVLATLDVLDRSHRSPSPDFCPAEAAQRTTCHVEPMDERDREQHIRERAYRFWQDEGEPGYRAAAHWHRAARDEDRARSV